ncbi:elongation factor P [Amphiplicatus metriothermophilus]|uniref:Elongation factor P n=1 Tax=Amphiplicatus metriothermophilus TaxID=1519374 RepID=A0A239PPA3_9PROT|nr:elongation factor P [Amphiplicatus metriothermophilus]MBB5518867.1 elongation factor P [Amphiplicatus metriothermophilus]SNT71980.1 translation elongation factor P (EF-P) [Amphiplicatus metriothermophilus]
MKIAGNAIRPGMVLNYKDKLCVVVKTEHRTPGNLRAFNQVEMQDIVSGTKYNERFSASEMVERVRLEQKSYQYLYDEGEALVFMDDETYDQINIPKSLVGDQIDFLQPNMTVEIESHEGRPIGVSLPETVTMAIAETEPTVKGQTASGSYKPALLENGARVMVPPYLSEGERIVVRIADREYVERAKD